MPLKKSRILAATTLVWLLHLAAQARFHDYSYGKLRDLGCDSEAVTIEGVKHGLNFSDACEAMAAAGVEIGVDFVSASTVQLSGSANKLERALAGPAPTGGRDVWHRQCADPALRPARRGRDFWHWQPADLGYCPGVTKPTIRLTGEKNEAPEQ